MRQLQMTKLKDLQRRVKEKDELIHELNLKMQKANLNQIKIPVQKPIMFTRNTSLSRSNSRELVEYGTNQPRLHSRIASSKKSQMRSENNLHQTTPIGEVDETLEQTGNFKYYQSIERDNNLQFYDGLN